MGQCLARRGRCHGSLRTLPRRLLARPTAATLAHRPEVAGLDKPWFATLYDESPIQLAGVGVGLFFLLSGYVIAISIDRYSRRGFLVGRLMRVLPPYAAGYLVTCAVVTILGNAGNADGINPRGILTGLIPGAPIALKTVSVPDGIVWTLTIELVFYAVCLLLFRALTTRWQAIVGVAAGCAAVQYLLLRHDVVGNVPTSLSGVILLLQFACPFLPIMLIGVVLSADSRGNMPRRALVLVPGLLAAYLLLSITSAVIPTTVKYRFTYVCTVAVFLLMWRFAESWDGNRAAGRLADISYQLYVVHPVLGYALLSVLAGHGVPPVLAVLAAAGAAILAATVLHLVVESPTHRLGQRWARSIAYQPPEPARA